MRILSIDLGNNLGVCLYDQDLMLWKYELYKLKGKYIFEDFCETISELLQTTMDIKLIVTATPVYVPGRIKILTSQMKKYGALCSLAWGFGVMVYPVKDSHAKKVVLGSGKADKDAIKRFYEGDNISIDSPDVRDARMFLDCYLKTI